MTLNKVFMVGNLTRDVDLRSVGDTSVASINIAMNETHKSKGGEKVDTTIYVQVEAWGSLADNSAKYLSKGSPVLVEGSLKLDTWEKDGQKRSMLKVRAFKIEFLPDGRKREEATQEPQMGW